METEPVSAAGERDKRGWDTAQADDTPRWTRGSFGVRQCTEGRRREREKYGYKSRLEGVQMYEEKGEERKVGCGGGKEGNDVGDKETKDEDKGWVQHVTEYRRDGVADSQEGRYAYSWAVRRSNEREPTRERRQAACPMGQARRAG